MTEIQWWYAQGDQQLGPVSPAELRQLATSGTLTPADLVWREGMPQWAPAAKVKGLFPEGLSEPPPSNESADVPIPPSASPLPSFITPASQTLTPPAETPEALAPNQVVLRSQRAPVGKEDLSVPLVSRRRGSHPGLEVILMCLQGLLWGTCVMVLLLGGILFAMARLRAQTPTDEAAAAVVFATFFLGSYIAARAGEKLSLLLQQYVEHRENRTD